MSEQGLLWSECTPIPCHPAPGCHLHCHGFLKDAFYGLASTALSDELLAATRTPEFAANARALQGYFNSSILPFESAYFGATATGVLHACGRMPRRRVPGHNTGDHFSMWEGFRGDCRASWGSACRVCMH